MVSPYKSARSGQEDDFNFFHSQLRITIERAFGMLVKRFAILRRAMAQSIPMKKKIAIVFACCKLHNYIMTEQGVSTTIRDVPGDSRVDDIMNEEGIPQGLLHGGDHSDDHDDNYIQQFGRQTSKRTELRRIVYRSGNTRPSSTFRASRQM
jgi:hypothetical protein